MILLPTVLAGFVLLLCAPFAMADAPESAEMAVQHKEMRHRQRRIIYNNDGNDCFLKKLSSPDEFLTQRIEPALGTQVDTIFYCTLVTTLYQHDTNIAERLDDLVDAIQSANKHAVNGRDNMRMLRAAGKDCLELVVERCHEGGVEVFWTHRVNGVHDSVPGNDWLLSQWKRKHPECLMGKVADFKEYTALHPRGWWSALDFARSEVTDYLCRINEEICRRYDVDGIEIDYFRAPLFFRPNLDFKPATEEQVEIMTGFQRRVREIARREGQRRGRPILLAVRVPMTKEACRHIGIDIEAWLAEDLLDLLVTGGGYVPFTMPTRELVELGHAHNVPVYPTISSSGMQARQPDGPQRRRQDRAWFGAAATAWYNGADGMYTFNLFPGKPHNPIFMTIGDPEKLAQLDKTFAIDNWGCRWGNMLHAVVQSQRLPVELDSGGKSRQVTLPIGDDIAGAAKAGTLAGAAFQIRFGGKAPDDLVEVRLNGEPIAATGPPGDDASVSYGVDPAKWLRGDNVLSFRVTSRGTGRQGEITVEAVELNVTYK